jgi:hypothetical protein
MTCKEFDAYLDRRSGKPMPLEILRHLQECPSCRILLQKMETARQEQRASGVPLAFAANLVSDLEPVRALPRTAYLFLACLTAAVLVCVWGVWVWGVAGWQAQSIATRILLVGSALTSMVISVYGLIAEMIPGSRKQISLAYGAGIPFAAFIGTALVTYHRKYPFDLAPADRSCFIITLVVAAVALPFVYVSIRRGALLNRFSTALQVAAVLASVSLLVLTFHCPILALPHFFIGHVSALALILLVGVLTGKALK